MQYNRGEKDPADGRSGVRSCCKNNSSIWSFIIGKRIEDGCTTTKFYGK